MMRDTLKSPEDLQKMPSLLGRIFRIALYGHDDFNYQQYLKRSIAGHEVRNSAWATCTKLLGLHQALQVPASSPDLTKNQIVQPHQRQHYAMEKY